MDSKYTKACIVHDIKYSSHSTICNRHTVSILGRDKGYTFKYSPPPEGVPEGKAQEKSQN